MVDCLFLLSLSSPLSLPLFFPTGMFRCPLRNRSTMSITCRTAKPTQCCSTCPPHRCWLWPSTLQWVHLIEVVSTTTVRPFLCLSHVLMRLPSSPPPSSPPPPPSIPPTHPHSCSSNDGMSGYPGSVQHIHHPGTLQLVSNAMGCGPRGQAH